MTSSQRPGPSPDQSLSIVVASMAGGLVMMGLVLVLLGAELVVPETWMLGVLGAAVLASLAAVLLVRPRDVHSGVILRVALLEAPAIMGMALAFVSSPTNLVVYLLPAAFSLVAIWLYARPSVVRAAMENRP